MQPHMGAAAFSQSGSLVRVVFQAAAYRRFLEHLQGAVGIHSGYPVAQAKAAVYKAPAVSQSHLFRQSAQSHSVDGLAASPVQSGHQ